MALFVLLVIIAVYVGFRITLSEVSKKFKKVYRNWEENLGTRKKLDHAKEHSTNQTLPQRKRGSLIPPNLSVEEDRQNVCLIPTNNNTKKKETIDEEVDPRDIVDILSLPTLERQEELGILGRTFSHVSFILKRQPTFTYPEIPLSIIRTPRIKKAIEKAATECFQNQQNSEDQNEVIKQKENKAIEDYEKMKSCISPVLLRASGWVIYKLLGRMLTGVKVNRRQITRLHACKKNIPIIYLPLHRSHLDYILLTFILYMNNLRVPLVAAGNNLHIPFFGSLLRGLGAFFIKRKLDPVAGQKDYIYRAVLHTYMEQSLHKGHSLEFFIEGGRSRSGKACLPKGGLLSVAVNSFLDGSIEDAYIVPVAISYEKLVDGNFISEQLGNPKKMESFGSAIKAIWRILKSNFGCVKVDFSVPFSLKDFLQNANNFSCFSSGRPNVYSLKNNYMKIDRAMPPRTSVYGTDIVIEDQRKVIKDLSEHIIFDAVQYTSLTTTNVLTFLLLTLHRNGSARGEVLKDLNWVQNEIKKRKISYEIIDSTALLKESLPLLGKSLVLSQSFRMEMASYNEDFEDRVKLHYYKPNITLPYVLELQYYANAVVPIFIVDSIITRAFLTIKKDKKASHIRGQKILKEAFQLCNILQYEFIFTPPNGNLNELLVSHFNKLLKDNVFERFEMPQLDEDTCYSDSVNVPYKVKENPSEEKKLKFLHAVSQPFIEAYCLTALTLPFLLGKGEVEENVLIETIHLTAKRLLKENFLKCAESFAVDPLKNSLKLYENWNVLGSVRLNSKNYFFLQPTYDSKPALDKLAIKILRYK